MGRVIRQHGDAGIAQRLGMQDLQAMYAKVWASKVPRVFCLTTTRICSYTRHGLGGIKG